MYVQNYYVQQYPVTDSLWYTKMNHDRMYLIGFNQEESTFKIRGKLMNNIIKKLEQVGQSISIKQYNSLDEMISNRIIDKAEVEAMFTKSSELICIHDPGDDDED